MGGTKTKIYCQGTLCQRCVLEALRTVKLGLTKVGNQAKSLKYSEKKVVFRTNLQQMFIPIGHRPQYTATDDAAETGMCTVCMSTLSHTSCGMLGESFVAKDQLQTSQVCVL